MSVKNHHCDIQVKTRGRGLYDITPTVRKNLTSQGAVCTEGLCHLFIHHTSASLLITENADPEVHRDLERFLSRLAPDGDPLFQHVAEGPDDMPGHIRTMLTQTYLAVPIRQGQLALGVWQGIYLYEHRLAMHTRQVTQTVQTFHQPTSEE